MAPQARVALCAGGGGQACDKGMVLLGWQALCRPRSLQRNKDPTTPKCLGPEEVALGPCWHPVRAIVPLSRQQQHQQKQQQQQQQHGDNSDAEGPWRKTRKTRKTKERSPRRRSSRFVDRFRRSRRIGCPRMDFRADPLPSPT
ncbi:hypothetical protein KM043_009909 [Ampulex compressa]|nr:hypothetical protein KM043_009909 [Ampulex compressa]